MVSGNEVVKAAKENRVVKLPIEAKNLTAGLDWAGNSGKLIANLLFKKECIGQAYTVSSAQNLKWYEVAEIYTELLGVKFEWVASNYPKDLWIWHYDRAYDRIIDNSKILKATGLNCLDFKTIKEGIEIELKKLGAI
jgi:nucleoside-diphosphate-sugar epimerase